MTAKINTNTGLKEVEVLATTNIMGYDFFVHEDCFEDFVVSEWLSGLQLPLGCDGCDSPEKAIEKAKSFLNKKGQERVDEVIMRGRLEWGQANLSSEASV